jgi:hypothetical protein
MAPTRKRSVPTSDDKGVPGVLSPTVNWTFASREDDEEEKAGNNDEAKNVGKAGVAPAAKAHSSVGSGNTVGDLPISGRKQPEVPTSDDKEGPCMPGPAVAQLESPLNADVGTVGVALAANANSSVGSSNESGVNQEVHILTAETFMTALVDKGYASSNNGSDDGNSSDSPSSST